MELFSSLYYFVIMSPIDPWRNEGVKIILKGATNKPLSGIVVLNILVYR